MLDFLTHPVYGQGKGKKGKKKKTGGRDCASFSRKTKGAAETCNSRLNGQWQLVVIAVAIAFAMALAWPWSSGALQRPLQCPPQPNEATALLGAW